MKKDIKIPEVKNVFIAIIQQWNEEYNWNDWVAYIINDSNNTIENVIVVSKGYGVDENGSEIKTSTMRHGMREIEPKSYAKIELIDNKVLNINNEFWMTFFDDNKLYDKKFVFKPKTIAKENLQLIPHINIMGIMPF